MFINCPYCSQLVATDPIGDLPPTHCPHCGSLLRRDHTRPDEVDDDPPPLDLGTLLDPVALAEAATRPAPSAVAVHSGDRPDEAQAAAHADAAIAPTAEEADPPAIPVSPPQPPARPGRRLPSFARGDGTRPALPFERWLILAIAILTLLLLLQLLLADRARLAGDARWRPLLASVCGALRCDLPPWREPGAFTLLQRDVRQHPGIAGALRVTATFRNDARWAQPWPRLQLTLSDVNGRPAGARSFDAAEYLGGTPGQPELASGETAAVAMDIMEPAPQIVAYDFRFR